MIRPRLPRIAFAVACLAVLLPRAGAAQSAEEALRDVAYGPHPGQTMDIYLPESLDNPPAILMLHGGAWMTGDKSVADVVANKAAHWRAKGYVFISANTRLVPDADPVEQAGDLALALATAQSMAGSWGGDPSRFVLMGHSSGAHVVALLAADPSIAADADVTPWRGTVALDGGAYDIVRIMKAKHAGFYDQAFGPDPAFWTMASPLHRLTGKPAPMLLVCSSLGRASCPQADALAARVKELGGQATVLPEKLNHWQINGDLGLPGPYTEAVDAFLGSLGLP